MTTLKQASEAPALQLQHTSSRFPRSHARRCFPSLKNPRALIKTEAAISQPSVIPHQPSAAFASRVQRPPRHPSACTQRLTVHASLDGLLPVRVQISKATCKHTTQGAELNLSFSPTPSAHGTHFLCHLHHRRAHLHYTPRAEKKVSLSFNYQTLPHLAAGKA